MMGTILKEEIVMAKFSRETKINILCLELIMKHWKLDHDEAVDYYYDFVDGDDDYPHPPKIKIDEVVPGRLLHSWVTYED